MEKKKYNTIKSIKHMNDKHRHDIMTLYCLFSCAKNATIFEISMKFIILLHCGHFIGNCNLFIHFIHIL